jgi:Bacterial HORMA domain family 1
MSTSFSLTESDTFTLTDAKHMAAKVAADLKRMQRMYGAPSDLSIGRYEEEVIALLHAGYLDAVTYGYRRNDNWIEPTLRYWAQDLIDRTNDDDPGRVRPGANISDATFYSFLTYSSTWHTLTAAQQATFESRLPLARGGASEPGVSGYFSDDRTYSAGGRALNRSSVRSWA